MVSSLPFGVQQALRSLNDFARLALAPMNKITDHAIVVVVLSTATLIVCLTLLLTGII